MSIYDPYSAQYKTFRRCSSTLRYLTAYQITPKLQCYLAIYCHGLLCNINAYGDRQGPGRGLKHSTLHSLIAIRCMTEILLRCVCLSVCLIQVVILKTKSFRTTVSCFECCPESAFVKFCLLQRNIIFSVWTSRLETLRTAYGNRLVTV